MAILAASLSHYAELLSSQSHFGLNSLDNEAVIMQFRQECIDLNAIFCIHTLLGCEFTQCRQRSCTGTCEDMDVPRQEEATSVMQNGQKEAITN